AEQITRTLKLQEELGLDVLVHGEFERNDMVEYFGEQLEGFAFTEHGWVQSYGSRYVKPPIIYGDVSRPKAMTVRWSTFAQSKTARPVKGMLTGPVTILQWSFVRDDQPRAETAKQLALAIRDEVTDLAAAGIRVIQIDEPALREGLPLRRAEWLRHPLAPRAEHRGDRAGAQAHAGGARRPADLGEPRLRLEDARLGGDAALAPQHGAGGAADAAGAGVDGGGRLDFHYERHRRPHHRRADRQRSLQVSGERAAARGGRAAVRHAGRGAGLAARRGDLRHPRGGRERGHRVGQPRHG